MTILSTWARRWHVPPEAEAELRAMFGETPEAAPNAVPGQSEASVQARVRLEAATKGLRLWRNNVGAGYDETGNFMRWGLANDSKQVNSVLKSSDLIGIRPIVIQSHMMGLIVGQFVAREIKHGDWKWTGSEREKAQRNFINLVNSLGGDARFASSEGTL